MGEEQVNGATYTSALAIGDIGRARVGFVARDALLWKKSAGCLPRNIVVFSLDLNQFLSQVWAQLSLCLQLFDFFKSFGQFFALLD